MQIDGFNLSRAQCSADKEIIFRKISVQLVLLIRTSGAEVTMPAVLHIQNQDFVIF